MLHNNDIATTGSAGGFRASSTKKYDKWCNLVSSEVLLKFYFKEFIYFKKNNSNTVAQLPGPFSSIKNKKGCNLARLKCICTFGFSLKQFSRI